ncbi:hypothetical protein F5Y15DRAFT_353184 [Xylariaceae sp. FL0016]|nr:hypothetical protein F5Y15DRAFT_353184 [Xylariaceae sp. FL0016]
MPVFLQGLVAALAVLAGAAMALEQQVMAAPYNISVQYVENGATVQLRTWYGDGHMYVGQAVPAGIETAFNFTVPNQRADLLYITPSDPDPNDRLIPNPTFLVLDDSPGATSPLFFAHSATGLADTDVLLWTRYEFVLFPLTSGNKGLVSRFYLDDTEEEGTYVVKWRAGGSASRAVGAKDLSEDGVVDGTARKGELKSMRRLGKRERSLRGKSVTLLTN